MEKAAEQQADAGGGGGHRRHSHHLHHSVSWLHVGPLRQRGTPAGGSGESGPAGGIRGQDPGRGRRTGGQPAGGRLPGLPPGERGGRGQGAGGRGLLYGNHHPRKLLGQRGHPHRRSAQTDGAELRDQPRHQLHRLQAERDRHEGDSGQRAGRGDQDLRRNHV